MAISSIPASPTMQSRQTDAVSRSTETLAIPVGYRAESRSANRIPAVLPRSAPKIARQSQPAKFRFPDRRRNDLQRVDSLDQMGSPLPPEMRNEHRVHGSHPRLSARLGHSEGQPGPLHRPFRPRQRCLGGGIHPAARWFARGDPNGPCPLWRSLVRVDDAQLPTVRSISCSGSTARRPSRPRSWRPAKGRGGRQG